MSFFPMFLRHTESFNVTLGIVKDGVLYGTTEFGATENSSQKQEFGAVCSTVLFLRIKNQEDFLPEDFATWLRTVESM